ncbi:MAG: hypothetical protein U9R37_06610 [Campylobacterota bacterium]|nr:hypothetical protein [Campylobacterota bacterium]
MNIQKNYRRKIKQLAKILLLTITNDINPKNIIQQINEYHTQSFKILVNKYFLNDEYLKIISNDIATSSNRELYVIKEICLNYAMKKYYNLENK